MYSGYHESSEKKLNPDKRQARSAVFIIVSTLVAVFVLGGLFGWAMHGNADKAKVQADTASSCTDIWDSQVEFDKRIITRVFAIEDSVCALQRKVDTLAVRNAELVKRVNSLERKERWQDVRLDYDMLMIYD